MITQINEFSVFQSMLKIIYEIKCMKLNDASATLENKLIRNDEITTIRFKIQIVIDRPSKGHSIPHNKSRKYKIKLNS